MNKKEFLSSNIAVAKTVRLCRPDVIASYPITPQTTIVEKIAEYVEDKSFDTEFLQVESEHSALAAAMGASSMGCRTFTATSSQGLLYMCEMLHYVSGSRYPIVMANANRTVAAPWNIFGDHRDSISMRDSGWMQVYVENGQEVIDTIIQAYKIAENKEISTPIMVNLDGYVLTHTYDLVELPSQKDVDDFLPPFETENKLSFEKPKSLSFTASPEWQTEFRYQQYEAMEKAKEVIKQVDLEFFEKFGRQHGGMIEEYRCDDADFVLVAMGSVVGTTRLVVDKLREEGKKVGLVKLRFFRPFPKEYFQSLSKRVKAVGVIDKNISFGYEGAVYSEVKAALFTEGTTVKTVDFIAGLSGRDITKEDLAQMYEQLEQMNQGTQIKEVQFIGLRWDQ